MPTYAPNPFSGQMAQANALRSYVPNYFAQQGGSPTPTGGMAPHLSVPASARPYADDIALLQGSEYANQLPNLDAMWRFSPNTYEASVNKLLMQPGAAGALESLRAVPVPDYDARVVRPRPEGFEGSSD